MGIYPEGASTEGVLDLSGNVWEWCLNEYDKPDRVQPGGEESRVLRGGSWFSSLDFARAHSAATFFRTTVTSISGFGWCAWPPFAEH